MKSFEVRLERLERLAATRERERSMSGQFCGAIPLAWSGDVIHGCLFVPCDRVPTWQEAAGLWRKHETCPDTGRCRYALGGACVPKGGLAGCETEHG